MEFDPTLAFAKSSPREERKTEIDGAGVEGIHRLPKLEAQLLFAVQLSGDGDEHLRKVGIDAPVSVLVGLGQGTARDLASDAGVIELGLKGPQTGLNISKTLSIGQLRESHAQELIQTRELAEPVIAPVTAHALVEFVSWQEVHQL